MFGIFSFLAKRINYTTAVAICTLILLIILISCFFLPLTYLVFAIFTESTKWINLIPIKNISMYFLVSSLVLYCLPFGILGPVKIPAFQKFLREINRDFKGHTFSSQISNEALIKLYNNVNKLIINNTLFTAVIQCINMAFLVYIIFNFFPKYLIGAALLSLSKAYVVLIILTMFFFAILATTLTFFYTDSLTKKARGACYNELLERRIFIQPKSYIKLSFKSNLIIIFMLINTSLFVVLFMLFKFLYRTNIMSFENALMGVSIYLAMTIVTSIILVIITYNPINKIVKDITNATIWIARSLNPVFKMHPIEKEFADAEYLILSMNNEIVEHRKNLEKKVEDRTAELQKALVNLKERDDLLQKQLDMAGSIQRGILPSKIDDWNELKFATRYFSMDKIGGDFYDVSRTIGNKILLYVADVSGHGIPAALVTTMAKVSFGNAFLKYDSPKKIFREVNHELLDHVKTQDYLTCFMAVIDDKYNLTYANASHQKAILLRTSENRVELLDTGGLFIAAIEDARETYEEKTTKLNYDDKLILYTDGIPEASNINKESYSNERFEKSILNHKDLPLKEFTNAIIDDLQSFIGGSQVQDDITLLVVDLKRDETIDIIKNVVNLNDEKKYHEAIELLIRGLAKYPDNQKLLYNLAKSYFRINDYKNVIKTIEKYILRDKDNKYAFYLLGAASFKIMNFDTAIESFQKAIGLDPNFVNALFALGMTYKEKGQLDEATRSFEKIKNIDEDNKMADYELSHLR